jgi:hypothetical protein
MDMSTAYIAWAMEHFPGACVVFTAFHIKSRLLVDKQPSQQWRPSLGQSAQ